MKRVIIFTSLLLLTSCFAHIQISTYQSDNIMISDNKYQYNDDVLSIDYKFNNEGDIFTFTITNKSDKDVYIITNKSYFAVNGNLYDYAGRSTTSSYSNYSIDGVSYTSTNSTYLYQNVSGSTTSSTSTIGKELIIPPGYSRTFSTFSIKHNIYINNHVVNGLLDGKDTAIYFLKEDSPITLTNAITYIYDGTNYEAINEMYLQNIQTLKIEKEKIKYFYGNTDKNQVVKILNFDYYTPIQYQEWSEGWVRIAD